MMRLIVAICCFVIAGTGIAPASHAQTAGPYLGFEGGLNIHATGQGRSGSAGFFGGGMVGYGFAGPRVELEVAYRTNESRAPGGDTRVLSGMINGLYDVSLEHGVMPHIGVGAGLAHVNDATHPAVQLIVGVDFAVLPRVQLGLDYKFMITIDAEDRGSRSFAYHDHSLSMAAKYAF